MDRTINAYCIFLDTLLEGAVPAIRDAEGKPYIFATRQEAEREIAENVISKLNEFLDGERDFEDAMTVSEYIVEVEVDPDGTLLNGR
jgi:hypothetical protein